MRRKSQIAGQAKKLLRRTAQLPWRATSGLPGTAQQKMKLLLGDPPLGSEGFWTALDPRAVWDQHPTPALIELALKASTRAAALHLTSIAERASVISSPFEQLVDQFPGEHYRLLASLTEILAPRLIVEIGTYTGASALAFRSQCPDGARVVTFDLLAWTEISGTLLRADDFHPGALEQHLGDLADPIVWDRYRPLFCAADLVFLDGPKDGVFEPLMLQRLAALSDDANFVVVVDDIRFLEMIEAWARFPGPKLDVTSFGHWSGTGLAMVGRPLLPGAHAGSA